MSNELLGTLMGLPSSSGPSSGTTSAYTTLPYSQGTLIGGYTSVTDTYKVDYERKDRLAEMEQLTRMYENVKHAGAPEEIYKPIEDTIKRYTAELFYLDTNQ
jgi:hypothetical protein